MGRRAVHRALSHAAPDHPLIEDLKRKDFTAFSEVGEGDACAAAFLDRYAKACTAAPRSCGF